MNMCGENINTNNLNYRKENTMKVRSDFVSNSSSCAYVFAIDPKNHDKSKWLQNTLRIYPDTKKIQMAFDDFESGGSVWSGVYDNWKFLCTQLIHWTAYDITDSGENCHRTKAKVLRDIYNSDEFCRINDAVIEYFKEQGIEMNGVELDPEEIREHTDKDGYVHTWLDPDCQLNHDSVFESLDKMLEEAKCASIAELIWGVKEIKIEWC